MEIKPKIVLAVTDHEKNSCILMHKPDMVEARVDLFRSLDITHARRHIEKRRSLHIPLLLTVRNQKKEGARKDFSDGKKWELLQALMPSADWVDIELSSPLCAKTIALARNLKKKTVISVHDFKSMPAHPQSLLKKALSSRADIVKFAAFAKTPDDLAQMMEFTLHNRKHSLVTMCLGPLGALSRLVLPAAGSRWVYTFVNTPTAPGQVDIKTLTSTLKRYYP